MKSPPKKFVEILNGRYTCALVEFEDKSIFNVSGLQYLICSASFVDKYRKLIFKNIVLSPVYFVTIMCILITCVAPNVNVPYLFWCKLLGLMQLLVFWSNYLCF